jgi:hypothetical protein
MPLRVGVDARLPVEAAWFARQIAKIRTWRTWRLGDKPRGLG